MTAFDASSTIGDRTEPRSPAAGSLRRRLAGGGMVALVVKVGAAGLGYAMIVALSRAMTDDGFGAFGIGFSAATVLAVGTSLGLHTAVLRFWPQYLAEEVPEKAVAFARWAKANTLRASLAAATVLLVLAAVLYPLGGPAEIVAGAALLISPLAFAEYTANAMRASGSMAAALVPRDIVWRAIVAGGALVVASLGNTIEPFVALAGTAGVLAVLVSVQALAHRRTISRVEEQSAGVRSRDLRADEIDVKEWKAASSTMWGSALVYVASRNIDVVLLAIFVPAATAGGYFASLRTAQLMTLMLVAANMVAAPMIAALFAKNETVEMQRMLRLVAVGILIPTTIVLLGVIVAGERLLELFDPTFVQYHGVLIVLGLGAAAHTLAGPTGYVLQMVGLHKQHLRLGVVYLVSFGVQLIAVPIFGIYGAAVPAACASLVWNALARRVALREAGVDPTVLSLFIRQPQLETVR